MKHYRLTILGILIIMAFHMLGCAAPKYLVNKDDCPEQAGDKYLICKKVEKIK